MKSLVTLLKIAQRRLDELAVEATRIQQEADSMRVEAATLAAREQTEIEQASADPMMIAMLPAYRQRMKLQRAGVDARIAEREATLELVRQRLSVAYQEKSKFEQLIEQEKLRDAAERATAEQAMLDEVAITRAQSA